jgi:hypothetical protein
MLAMADPSPRPPTWLAVLIALLGPLVLAILFLTAMDWANHPTVVPARPDPDAGSQQSALNSAIVFLHALGQLAFLAVGAWWTSERPRARVAFLLIAIPVSRLVFLLSFIGLIAK